MTVEPIRPKDIEKQKRKLPDEVIAAWNELLIVNFQSGGKTAYIQQQEAVAAILAAIPGLTKHDIYDKHYLDVESTYRSVGWKVFYTKSAYYETSDSYFTFEKPE
jgi:hypothetical protein